MTQLERIASELQHSLMGPAWHGESLFELLTGVTSEAAAAKPIPGAHSMHEIVLHLTRWVEIASGALNAQRIPEWPFPDDWPSPESTPWDRALADLKQATGELAGYTGQIREEQLDTQASGRAYSLGVLLLGVVQHAAYHGGQIALLRKLTRV
ncbi:MAG: DinB family protein [Bryobacteraceae bacterium]|nr:DinB family protein [Bryobacteraceae bacterium]